MPATAVPSTAPADEEGNPLRESLAKITGKNPLSTGTGTQGLVGYDPSQTFRPTGDSISVVTTPGTGATTAESWSHDIALENQRQQALQFEYQQQQDTLANAMKEAAATQSAQQQAFSQGITSAQAAREAASAKQQAALAPVTLKQAQQALESQKYDTALKQAQAEAAATQAWTSLGGMTLAQAQQARADQGRYAEFMQGQPITRDSYNQFVRYYNSPEYNTPAQSVWNANAQQWMQPASSQYYKPVRTVNNVFQASDAGL